MVRTEPGTVKRLPRHLRNEDIPSHTFTPRTYQVPIQENPFNWWKIMCDCQINLIADDFGGFPVLNIRDQLIEPLQIRISTVENVIWRHLYFRIENNVKTPSGIAGGTPWCCPAEEHHCLPGDQWGKYLHIGDASKGVLHWAQKTAAMRWKEKRCMLKFRYNSISEWKKYSIFQCIVNLLI